MKFGRRAFLMAAAGAARAAAQERPTATPPMPLAPKAKITSSVVLATLPGSFEKQVEVAARAGLQSVELQAEYAVWTPAELTRAKRHCDSFGLGIDALLAPARTGNPLGDLRIAIEAARRLEATQVVCRPEPAERARVVEATKRGGDAAVAAGITLLLEMDAASGLALLKEVGQPSVRLIFDTAAEHERTRDAVKSIAGAAFQVNVVRVADSPGRREPGSGAIDFPGVYRAIQKAGFAGYVAFAYAPSGDPVEGLVHAVEQFRAAVAPPGDRTAAAAHVRGPRLFSSARTNPESALRSADSHFTTTK